MKKPKSLYDRMTSYDYDKKSFEVSLDEHGQSRKRLSMYGALMASLWMLLLSPTYVLYSLALRAGCALLGYKINMENPKAGEYIKFMIRHPFGYMVRKLISGVQFIWKDRPMEPIDESTEYLIQRDRQLGLPEDYQILIK